MATVKRPSTSFSFTDWAKLRPNAPPPADRLDEVISDLTEALLSTQAALAELRRDDGKLKNGSVGLNQLDPKFADQLVEELRRDVRGKSVSQLVVDAQQAAAAAIGAERAIALRAEDAERAAIVGLQSLSKIETAASRITALLDEAKVVQGKIEVLNTEGDNASTWAEAQSDNAEKFKNEALAWAEYLAGPVVNSAEAPAYIANSPFPNGLYYQPVEGYGGTGGLWSAKWWAIYAGQIIGPWAFYYFGPWSVPPTPGSRNPNTGQVIPSPIAPGSMYYDTVSKQLMVWDGTQWVPSTVPVAGYKAQYVYVATAGQVNFSGPDVNGQTPIVGTAGSDVYVNGVLQVQGAAYDYTVNTTTNVLTTLIPLPAGAVVQWILVPTKTAAVAVQAYGVTLSPAPNGSVTAFTMSYSGGAVNAGTASELIVSLDGIVQQPGTDYTAAGAALSFSIAPVATARLWATWFKP